MNISGMFIAVLLTAVAYSAENPALGRWSCTNQSETGTQSQWTLLIREEGKALAGTLTDGDAELRLSEVKLDGSNFTFRFYVNGKPYTFDGKIDGRSLAGKYAGEEARGKLTCARPADQP